MRDWMFSSATPQGVPWNRGARVSRNAWKGGSMGKLPQLDVQVAGERLRVEQAALGRESRWHGHAHHVIAAQRVHGQSRDEAGVDAAGQRDERLAEPALAHVVAGAQHQRRVHLAIAFVPRAFASGYRRELRAGRSRRPICAQGEVRDEEVLLELRAPRDGVAVRPEHQARAVEHQLVLSAHEVHVGRVNAVARRQARHQALALPQLFGVVGRAVDGDDEPRAGGGLDRHGVVRVLEPDVLADVDAHRGAPHIVGGACVAGHEVAGLVEHAVVGQPPLVVHGVEPAVAGDGRGVAQSDRVVHESEHRRDAGRGGGNLSGSLQVLADELRAEHQVFGRVAGDGELGQGDQVSARVARPADVLDRLARVALQVANRGVYLGQREPEIAHGTSPTP